MKLSLALISLFSSLITFISMTFLGKLIIQQTDASFLGVMIIMSGFVASFGLVVHIRDLLIGDKNE